MPFFGVLAFVPAADECYDECCDECCGACGECFVPVDKDLYHAIHEEAKIAEKDRQKVVNGEGGRTERMSKMPNVENLCPASGMPSDTILSKMARGHERFAVLQDARPPFLGSMGPNIVLCKPEMMNLYSLSPEEYSEFRRDFYVFRDTHTDEILRAYAQTIDEQVKRPEFVELYGKKILEALGRFKQVLEIVIGKLGRKISVKDEFVKTGLTLSSFCQTWMKNGEAQAKAEFSVMSPHFQTKLNIKDRAALVAFVGEGRINDEDLDCIEKAQITTLKGYLDLDRGGRSAHKFADYTGAFVDLDRSWTGL